MSQDKPFSPAAAGKPLGWLRRTWRDAEHWPLAGQAWHAAHAAEDRALAELKARLDALDQPAARPAEAEDAAGVDEQPPPEWLLADLLQRERSVDPDRARRDLYRQVLRQLVPDEVAILRVIAQRGVATLCHIGASRLPAGPVSSLRLENASAVGQEAGVLLRECTPQYMHHLLTLGLLRVGDADTRLEADYELLLADPGVREVMDDVRERWRWYPRVLRHSVTLSHLGEALWRDCYPAARAIDKKRARY
ncbi:hypothetical protein [Salinisphaera japonica]|uniref:DUF4393 domain-containing protein n=1 Tax=Salinisphaera japonica YTM-1 TaxID=1209778 RepID=A0A423PYL7_9GAMM|nr:hypothetical protein [Salinisphaera japonica]ROO30630.1 hypothetical protein SAJA_04600 [Salinisphaera japonica YTM-1]